MVSRYIAAVNILVLLLQNGVNKKCEIFRETKAVFAKCIITKIVIWLLNRLGLCLKKISGALFRIFATGRQVVTLRSWLGITS